MTGRRQAGGMYFAVEDNGMGMTPERLAEVRTSLQNGAPLDPDGKGGYRLITGNEMGIILLDYICRTRLAPRHHAQGSRGRDPPLFPLIWQRRLPKSTAWSCAVP